MMASFYCQELIRNTKYLCVGYIQKLQQENEKSASIPKKPEAAPADQGSDQKTSAEEEYNICKQQTYYVEENEKILNLLISNCEPILTEIVSKFESFNKLNNIQQAFEQ